MSESETFALLPIEDCAVHPLARVRFDYGNIDELAESIKTMGQVQPGRAVSATAGDGGAKYLVYIGCRRFLACRKAGLRHFKAMLVSEIDEGRLQRELLTENVKRANLSVLEELNMLANYSKRMFSLEDLAHDVGLSSKLVRERVRLGALIQGKGLIEPLYKIECVSGFRFTYRHLEKMTSLEEEKWLPLAVQAAELNWKAEEIETLGRQFTIGSLLSALPAWGQAYVPRARQEAREEAKQPRMTESKTTLNEKRQDQAGKQEGRSKTNNPSRFQTITSTAQFIACPRCGSESVISFPGFPESTLLKPEGVQQAANAVPLKKESLPSSIVVVLTKCGNGECGREMVIIVDQRGDGTVLASKKELLSAIGDGHESEDCGQGSLVWDGADEMWLKCIQEGDRPAYYGYDESSKKWVIPVDPSEQAARVTR